MIPSVKCDVCGEVWMISTTHCLIPVTEKVKCELDKLKPPMNRDDMSRIRMLFGKEGNDLFPGARVGAAKVRKLRGKIAGELAWFESSAVISEEDFQQLRGMVGDDLKGVRVVDPKGRPALVELAQVPLNLRRLYSETRCEACDRRDMQSIAQDELDSIYDQAESTASMFSIPGDVVCGDIVKDSIEELRLRNCMFTEWRTT